MTHTYSFEKSTTYTRLPNGTDVYVLPTKMSGFVSCTFCFVGGAHSVYETQSIAQLFEAMMPAGTQGKKRRTVREFFEDRGASVHVSASSTHTFLSVRSNPRVFQEVISSALALFAHPVFSFADFTEAQTCLATDLEHAQEDTKVLARKALLALWYAKGHPHWRPSLEAQHKELTKSTLAQVRSFHHDTYTSLGSFVVVAGDVLPEACITFLREAVATLPTVPSSTLEIDSSRTQTFSKKDIIVYQKEKMNVDTLFGTPLSLTREHTDFHALSLGVAVLGGSCTGRLFKILRTQKSFTYGSYAGLSGFADDYAGMLIATALFPQDVFFPAREAFRDVLETWATKGVTEQEVISCKEELTGSYVVGLASVSARKDAIVRSLSMGRSLSYLDAYVAMMQTLTRAEINSAIRTHIHPEMITSASAGSVEEK